MALSLDLIPGTGPARRLILLTLVQSAANGLFLTSSAVFFVRVVGLSPGKVGLGLSVAGLAGFLATVPVGRLADRYGARRLLGLDYAALAALFAMYPFVRGLAPFTVLASLISICEVAGSPLRAAVTHALFGSVDAVRVRAQARSAFNVGFLAGAAVAGLALSVAGYRAFVAVCLGTAAVQAVCVLIVRRLPVPPPVPPPVPSGARVAAGSGRAAGPRRALGPGRAAGALARWTGPALRDRRFVLVTVANGVLELHTTVLTIGIPLWIVSRTGAPSSLYPALIVTNTVLVLLLQVRLSRGADSPAGAARLLRRAGLVLAAGCVVCAASQGAGAVATALVVLAGTAILSFGEIAQAAGGWGLSFELPPPGRQGEYQAVFGLGRGIAQFVGPALITFLLIGVGAAGWLVLAVLFAGTGTAGCWLVIRAPRPPAGSPLVPAEG